MNAIYVIIVLYKISLFEAESYKTLIKPNHLTNFLVYDNSPQEGYTDLSQLPEEATYVHDERNSGLSVAYNRGAQIAYEQGYKRVLLLDQDTLFMPGTWQAYINNLDYNGITSPMIVTKNGLPFSPVRIDKFFLKPIDGLQSGEYSLHKYAVVNSGTCVPTNLFKQCGGYDEKVTLDFSDFQFQVRLRKLQPKFMLLDAKAIQDFSNDCSDLEKIKKRFELYLKSAVHFKTDNAALQGKHFCEVMKHTLSLTVRTRSIYFIGKYIKEFIKRG